MNRVGGEKDFDRPTKRALKVTSLTFVKRCFFAVDTDDKI